MRGGGDTRQREEQRVTHRNRLRHTGPQGKAPADGLQKEQLLSLFHRCAGSEIVGSEASLCLCRSDSKGTRVSPKGPCGVTCSVCTFPKHRTAPQSPRSRALGQEVPTLAQNVSLLFTGLLADREAYLGHVWSEGEGRRREQEKGRQKGGPREKGPQNSLPSVSGRNPDCWELPSRCDLS